MLIKFQVKSVLEQNLYKKKCIYRNDLNNSIKLGSNKMKEKETFAFDNHLLNIHVLGTNSKFIHRYSSITSRSSNDEEFNDYP